MGFIDCEGEKERVKGKNKKVTGSKINRSLPDFIGHYHKTLEQEKMLEHRFLCTSGRFLAGPSILSLHISLFLIFFSRINSQIGK